MRFKIIDKKLLMDRRVRESLKRAYKKIFEGPPWFENWPLKKIDNEISEMTRNNASGLIGFDGNEDVIAFIIFLNRQLSDPIVWKGSYVIEFGVIPELQNCGIGTELMENFLEQFKMDAPFLFKTINPIVLKILEKFGTIECAGRSKNNSALYYVLSLQ